MDIFFHWERRRPAGKFFSPTKESAVEERCRRDAEVVSKLKNGASQARRADGK
jgi:hypothetical protein